MSRLASVRGRCAFLSLSPRHTHLQLLRLPLLQEQARHGHSDDAGPAQARAQGCRGGRQGGRDATTATDRHADAGGSAWANAGERGPGVGGAALGGAAVRRLGGVAWEKEGG